MIRAMRLLELRLAVFGLLLCAAATPALAQTGGDATPAEASTELSATTAADAAAGPVTDTGAAELAAREQLDLAQKALDSGDQAAAEACYRQALALSPSPQTYLDLISLLTADPERTTDLDRTWVELLETFPDHPVVLLAYGDRLYATGSYGAAAESYARGSTAAPRDARYPRRAGNCRYSLGDFTAAALLYRQSLELKYDPLVVANLAGAQAMAGKPAEALDTWQRYLMLHPEDAQLVMQYGTALAAAGDSAAALTLFQRGQELAPDSDVFHNRAAMCLFQLGRLEEAITEVQAAIALKPDPQYYANITIGYEELGDYDQATAWYRAGLEHFPDNVALLDAYAAFLLAHGDGRAALERLRAIAEQTGSAAAYANVARQAQLLGESGLAETAFLKALALAPRDTQLNIDYARLLAGDNRDEELLAHLGSARQRLAPGDYSWLIDEIASYWLDAGEYVRGAGLLERIIAQDPQAAVAYNGLAMLEHLQDDTAAALATVKRGLNDAGDNYFGRYLEVYLTQAAYGAAAARELAPALIEHPEADADAFTLYLELQSGSVDMATLADVARRGLAANPDSVALLEILATLLYNSNDTAGVVDVLADRRYARLEWAPRSELLGICYMALGNNVKAAAELTSAVNVNPEDPTLWSILGQAQFFIGVYDEARTSLTRALALDSAEANAHLWLGYVLLEQGELDGAQLSFEAAGEIEYAPLDLPAWLALGRARLALKRNDLATANRQLDIAAQYQLDLPDFTQMLEETKALAAR